MTRFRAVDFAVLPFLILALLFGLSAYADDDAADNAANSAADDTPDDEGWVSLFNGETLENWEPVEAGGSGKVEVKDGAIAIKTGVMSSGIHWKPGENSPKIPTTNYEITYTAQRSYGNDFFAALTFPVGDSFCTLVNGGWGGTLVGLSSLNGMDASENSTGTAYAFKNKIWYIFRVRVTDRLIRVWLDDEEIVKAFLDGRQVSTRVEMNLYQPLGFATWICDGKVKNIMMRNLTEEEIAEINEEADKAAGASRRFPVK